MEIKPTYISFEQAKWLKEKGFDVHCTNAYAEERLINKSTGGDRFTGVYRFVTLSKFHKRYYHAPEQWQVVEWLRINHGIWVYVKRGCKIINNEAFDKFQPIIEFIPQVKFDITNIPVFDLPQEAYSAAFDYIKENNLI